LSEWTYAQNDPSEELCQIHFFSMKKRQTDGDVEFQITVREYISPPDPALRFFAQTDKQTNQKIAPFTPSGWGPSLVQALSECVKAIHRFPYQAANKT